MRIFGISVFTLALLALAYWLGSRNTLAQVVNTVTGGSAS